MFPCGLPSISPEIGVPSKILYEIECVYVSSHAQVSFRIFNFIHHSKTQLAIEKEQLECVVCFVLFIGVYVLVLLCLPHLALLYSFVVSLCCLLDVVVRIAYFVWLLGRLLV